ncbi:MAG: sulfatase-like hydrolase/transferase [Acidobacteria bacterium]|nr:sulfatase-like hydrolase/transferase [Acidobacteriota bacterium]
MKLSRRHFFFGSLALPALAAKKPAGETPHIVLILAEHLPAWLLSCYGNKEVRTPNIDRLSLTGTRLMNHIAAHGDPAAARAALLTGMLAGGGTPVDKLLSGVGYSTHTAASGAEAVRVLEAESGAKPFLLTVTLSGFAPPYPGGAPYLGQFANAKLDTFEQVPPAPNIAAGKEMFTGDLLGNLRAAAAAVVGIDAEVGVITAKLSQKKLLDNTLIVFTSPTGSLIGRHGLWNGSAGSNPPNFYEEVIATPMIWVWPARVAPSNTRPELVSGADLTPTICDLTPADLPAGTYPGRSYLPLVQNKPLPKKQPWRKTAFLADGRFGVARDDRYKLVLRDEGKGPNELYDLTADARERVNQYDNPQFLAVRTQLTGELTRWRQKFTV